MGRASSNEELGAGPNPLTRRWQRSHQGSLGTGHQPATVQRPRTPLQAPGSVLLPLSRAETQRGRQWLNPLASLSVVRLGQAVFSFGAALVGLGFRDESPGAAGTGSGLVATREPGTCSPFGRPRISKLRASSRRLRRAPAPKGRHSRTPPSGQPPFIFQRPLLRFSPRTHFSFSPLRCPFLTPWVWRFSWKRRCRL